MRARLTLVSIAALLLGIAGSGLVGTGLADTPPRAPDQKNAARASPPKVAEAKPDPSAQVVQPAGRQKILDDLFDRLGKTRDEAEAQGIAGAIQRVWSRSGSDTADIVMERAGTLIRQKDWKLAEEMLNRLVDIEPQWAEAWNRRATVRFFQRDTTGAMEDLAHVLQLEPRHFTALVGVGAILERNEQNAQALRVFRRVLEINPRLDEIQKKVDKLSIEVEGREI
jgi:tetratricopeptide (TPR) repeat protein